MENKGNYKDMAGQYGNTKEEVANPDEEMGA
jgi:hypothetical protein